MIDEKTAFAKAVDLAIDTTRLIITLSTSIITLSVTVLKLFIANICFCNMFVFKLVLVMFPCLNNLGLLLYTWNYRSVCAYRTRKNSFGF